MNDNLLLAFESIQLNNDVLNVQAINKRLDKRFTVLNNQTWESRDLKSGYHKTVLSDGTPNYNRYNSNAKLTAGQRLPASKISNNVIPGYQDIKPAL